MEFPGLFLDASLYAKTRRPEGSTVYDLLIIGGGPASMSAAIYAARKVLNLAILTSDMGGQMRETSDVENYLGFQNVNAMDLVKRFEEQVRSFDIAIGTDIKVKEIRKNGNLFDAHLEDGTIFSGKSAIVATGERHRHLAVPGEKEFTGKGVSYCATCDAPLYKEKKVMIIGGGNSAFTTALDLSRGNSEIVMVNFVKGWQADAVMQDRIRKYEKAQMLDFHETVHIEGKEKAESAVVRDRDTGTEKRIPVDGIFVEIGLLPNSEPVKDLLRLNDRGEVIVDCACGTSVPGVFAAGDVTSVPHKQIIISAGEGAKAALSAYDYLVNASLI